MKRYLGYAVVLLAIAAPAFAQTLTPSVISRDIQTKGARATVQSLSRKGSFDAVLDKIASGNTAWVRISRDLATGTDAGDSTGLSVALAKALPKNPKAVLAVLDDGPVTGASVVCGVPFIEPTPREVKDYLNRAIPAVRRTPESERLPQRAPCLRALEHIAEQTSAHRS
ncbi:hypothetical protein ACFQ3P_04325 [Paraburkholderia sabiae]|uniref:Uncharacterized protein n=1 Tax=Paraburkholderia sabiae TaxID=273251 RepID=A0ABU9QSD6_9BURK|nr:hypothetical protein [Paraburkholderia sabiae]WJZ79094.1 hypothetical protein QEN71_34535 [Paraburkholderia sabiae]CAD6514224.1 hypothetical protein LMG24235_00866 [Paraburkholderia sabiae]